MILINLRKLILKYKYVLEIIYLILFAFYYSFIFFESTMFHGKFLVPVYLKGTILVTLLIGIKFLTISKEDWKEWLIAVVFLLCFALVWLSYGDITILILGVYIVAAKDVDFRKIVWVSFSIGLSIMAISIVASQIGIIKDLVYYMGGSYRHSFGITYSTDFAAHILFLFLQYCYLRKGELKWFEYIIVIILTVIMFFYTRARTNAICMILTCLGIFMERKLLYKKFQEVMCFIMPICAGIMLLLTSAYRADNLIFRFINESFSNRLTFGHTGIQKYGISLWGQAIPMVGFGGSTNYPDNYFMLDSSYILILLTKGIVMLIILCFMFTREAKRAKVNGQGYLLIILSVLSIQSMMEHHLLDISYNVFLLLFFVRSGKINRLNLEKDKRKKCSTYL